MIRIAFRKLTPIAALCMAITPGVALADTTKIDPSWPDWLKKAMVEEIDKLRFEALSVGPVKTVMPGKIKDRQEVEPGLYYALSEDGSGSVFECWFYSNPIDLASSTVNFAEASIKALSGQYGPVGIRSVHHVDSGSVDESPFLALEWLYTVGEAPNTLAALTKVRASERNGLHVVCSHSMLGYRQSFADGFAEVVRRLEPVAEVAAPYYQEVAVFTVNDVNSGFAKVTMRLDEEGDTRIDSTEAMLIPVSSTEVATSDSSSVSWSRPDGSLINTLESSADNGELSMNLSLRPDETGAWIVDGTLSGKPIDAQLGTEAEPLSSLGQMRSAREFAANPKAEPRTFPVWVPDADPTVFSDVTVDRDADAKMPGAVSISLGPLVIRGEIDSNGSLRHGTMDIGGVIVGMERVFVAGAIP